MIKRTFENPFHIVVLDYEETKKESSYENELVARYIAFLNKMQEKRDLMKELTNRYHYETLVAEQTAEALQKIEDNFKPIIEVISRFKKDRILDIPEFLELRKLYDSAAEEFMDFHETHVDMLREEIVENEKKFDSIYKWFEDDESGQVYEEFDDFAGELYANYNNYALDLGSFDNDTEAMKGDWQKADEEWKSFFEFREAIVKTNMLVTERINSLNTIITGLRDDIADMNTSWSALNN